MMLDRGFLATNAFYATHAHQETHIRSYLGAVPEVSHITRPSRKVVSRHRCADPSRIVGSND